MVGKVKFFNNEKGWGYLTGEDDKEYFVHFSEIKAEGYKSLETEQEVEFDIGKNDKGTCATNVVPV